MRVRRVIHRTKVKFFCIGEILLRLTNDSARIASSHASVKSRIRNIKGGCSFRMLEYFCASRADIAELILFSISVRNGFVDCFIAEKSINICGGMVVWCPGKR